MKKFRALNAAKRTAFRLFYPGNWYQLFKLATTPRSRHRRDDLQLDLYGKVLPSGFLHYAYFEDTNLKLPSISIQDVLDGQYRYADKLMELIPRGRILDVGCGLGGMVQLLLDRGDEVVAITPDGPQAAYVRRKFPNVEVHECKFQRFQAANSIGQFDAVLNSESLQYIPLDRAADLVNQLLKPGGSWIVADYFKLKSETTGSGHSWSSFEEILGSRNFEIAEYQDVTPNILVSLQATYGLADNVGRPAIEFMIRKLALKRPLVHYMFQDVFEEMWRMIDVNLNDIEPEQFAATRKYVMLAAVKPAKSVIHEHSTTAMLAG